ncbi:MAG: uracil-DNA glycosylase [Clostridia bacterium]|nr:uracil-DNA glycosylase [Clostridia bacterium]
MEKFKTEIAAHFAALYEGNARTLVYGEGAFHAKLMMVGEAPGEQETIHGRPFVGKAGKNLSEFLALTGLEREEIYITNTVKIRPTKISNAGRMVNRPPTKEEIALFLPWLRREIALVKPLCIATLGNVPLKALTSNKYVIGDVHGQFMDIDGVLLYPMYHPASLIYNPKLRDVYTEDVIRLGNWVKEHA